MTKQIIAINAVKVLKQIFAQDSLVSATPLQVACKKGVLEIVKTLISEHEHNSAVHSACIGGNIAVVQYLVEECAVNINGKDEEGNTPLLTAARNGHLIVVKYLIKQNCDPLQKDADGNTALHLAALFGHLTLIKYYKEQLNCNLLTTNDAGQLPIHYACSENIVEYFKFVKDCAVDINSKDKEGSTPLLTAAVKCHLTVIEYLIKQGCDPLQRNENGDTLVHLAALNDHVLIIVKYFKYRINCNLNVTNSHGQMPIHYACGNGNFSTVQYLAEECSACIDTMDLDGSTPLLMAASKGHLSVIEFLIEQEYYDYYDYLHNAIHVASLNGHQTVLKYFKEKLNCDLNIANSKGQMPIHLACNHGMLNVVQYLIEECASDINFRDKEGSTLFLTAVMHGQLTVIEYLIKKGCDPLQTDAYDNTACHIAAFNNQLSTMKYLRESLKCDFNVFNSQGQMPIHCACGSGKIDIVQYLVKECAVDISAKDRVGRTPVQYAARYSQLANC